MSAYVDAGGESPPVCRNSSYSLRSAELLEVFLHTTVCLGIPLRSSSCIIVLFRKWREGSAMIVYRELPSLEKDLGFQAKTLYAVSNDLRKHYHTVQLPKKSGGARTLSVPDELLKSIQRKITEVLLVSMPVSGYAKAYRYGSSAIRNAQPHVGKNVVLKLDILHFFDSVRYSAVKDMVFPGEIYGENLRTLLTMLCYYRDALPQGAPSSPAITNIILYGFDEKTGRWCRDRKITYTRYCDDMTFSGDFCPGDVILFVKSELKKLGFLLNEQKTRIQRSCEQQKVTGIVVNEKLSVPGEDRRKLRQELYYCRKYGIADHLRRIGAQVPEETYRQHLLGKVSYFLQISPGDSELAEYRQWLRRCDS